MDKRQKRRVELLEARRDAVKNFEPLKKILHQMARPIALNVQGARLAAILSGGNDGLHAALFGHLDDGVRIVALVGQQGAAVEALDKLAGSRAVRLIARPEDKAQGVAQGVAGGVDFGVQASPREANRLRAPFFWAPALD